MPPFAHMNGAAAKTQSALNKLSWLNCVQLPFDRTVPQSLMRPLLVVMLHELVDGRERGWWELTITTARTRIDATPSSAISTATRGMRQKPGRSARKHWRRNSEPFRSPFTSVKPQCLALVVTPAGPSSDESETVSTRQVDPIHRCRPR